MPDSFSHVSFRFSGLFNQAAALPVQTGHTFLFWATLCFFVGACGKLKFLFTSGCRMRWKVRRIRTHSRRHYGYCRHVVCRSNALFSRATLMIVAVVGSLTAIFAATIGFTQTDIKRVAYSTVSQLGYMFAALGVGASLAAFSI